MISAVIFDVDGTLVDSNEFHVAAWEKAFRHFGKEFPREKLHQNIGKGAEAAIKVEIATIGLLCGDFRQLRIRNPKLVVPVVQRIEQGFPKGKTAFLQEFAHVITSGQTAVIERVELLLRSSRVISAVPIFTHPGDTKILSDVVYQPKSTPPSETHGT